MFPDATTQGPDGPWDTAWILLVLFITLHRVTLLYTWVSLVLVTGYAGRRVVQWVVRGRGAPLPVPPPTKAGTRLEE